MAAGFFGGFVAFGRVFSQGQAALAPPCQPLHTVRRTAAATVEEVGRALVLDLRAVKGLSRPARRPLPGAAGLCLEVF